LVCLDAVGNQWRRYLCQFPKFEGWPDNPPEHTHYGHCSQ
jgi:hypothetical protein